jgi:hypothetical protein
MEVLVIAARQGEWPAWGHGFVGGRRQLVGFSSGELVKNFSAEWGMQPALNPSPM